jgi:hypothetical protein
VKASVFRIIENKSSRQHLNGNRCVISLMRRLKGCRRIVKYYNNTSDHHGFQAALLWKEVEVVIYEAKGDFIDRLVMKN